MELIGSVGVDAGCIWVGDPCYVFGEDASHGVKSWHDYCDILDETGFWKDNGSHVEPLGQGIGMHIQTLYGDGEYPVYAEFQNGRVSKVIIDFAPEEGDC